MIIEEHQDILKEELHLMNFIEESILLSIKEEEEIKFTEEDLVVETSNQEDLCHHRRKEEIMDTMSLVHHSKELSKLEYYINIYIILCLTMLRRVNYVELLN